MVSGEAATASGDAVETSGDAVGAGVCSTGEGLISGAVATGAVALASAFFDFLLETAPYLVMNFSTRPSVSTNFCFPVKNGWQAEHISTCSLSRVEPVVNLLPQAQTTCASCHAGWIFSFT